MRRIAIIGNAAGGKTTLARALAARLDLPLLSVDDALWTSDWTRVADARYAATHTEFISGARWVIDGLGPWASVGARLDAADTIIFVDLPVTTHFRWAMRRMAAGKGPPPRLALRLCRMMLWVHRDLRPEIVAAIEARAATRRIVRIRSIRALRAFAADPFGACQPAPQPDARPGRAGRASSPNAPISPSPITQRRR